MGVVRPEEGIREVREDDGAWAVGLLEMACGCSVQLCSDSVIVSAELLLNCPDGIALDGYTGSTPK
jgi:hypothetical protein